MSNDPGNEPKNRPETLAARALGWIDPATGAVSPPIQRSRSASAENPCSNTVIGLGAREGINPIDPRPAASIGGMESNQAASSLAS